MMIDLTVSDARDAKAEAEWQKTEQRIRTMLIAELSRGGRHREKAGDAAARVFFTSLVAAGEIIRSLSAIGQVRDMAAIESMAIRYLTASMRGEELPRGGFDG